MAANREDIDSTRTILRGEASRAPFKLGDVPSGPQPGDRISRYLVDALIGSGGMGVVVSASDPELRRQVALKVVRRDIGDEAYRLRLVREARAMAQLEHDNVVRIYDAGEHEGEVFVAMELVRGETVGQWLRTTPRRWREVLARFVAAGRGLAAAHAAGMIHRDFKPDNILVRASDGRVCVTDFGLAVPVSEVPHVGEVALASAPTEPGTQRAIATPVSSDGAGRKRTVELRGARAVAASATPAPASLQITRTGGVVGTPPYMAPEQHRGSELDARADVFSFCVSLYEGLYGERPFTLGSGESGVSAWARAIGTGRVRPAPAGRRVPAWLRRVLLRGLATDPAARWPDMDDLLAALGENRRRARWPRLVVTGAVVAAAAVAVAVWTRREPPDEAPAGYVDGMRLLHQLRFHDAAAAFERATAERPDSAAAWLALAQARHGDSDNEHAKPALARATALVGPDDRARKLLVEGLAAEIDEKLDIAIDRYQAYFRFYPGDVDAGLELADAQTLTGKANDALATLRAMASTVDDGRIALAEAKAGMALSDWTQTKAAGTRAIALAEANGAREIAARALLRRGFASERLGDGKAGLADVDAAGALIRQLGDRMLEARQLTMKANMMRDADDIAGSLPPREQAVAIDRAIGEPHNLASDLLNLANTRADLGELDRVGPMYEEAFALLRQVDDRELLSHGLYNYGLLVADLGQYARAGELLRQAISEARSANLELLGLKVLGALARNTFSLGLVKQAEVEWREVATNGERLGDPDTLINGYSGTAIALSAEGDPAGALKASEQAVRLAEKLGPTSLARERAWHVIYLAEAGQYAAAAELAISTADALRDAELPRDELIARSVAAYALAKLGRKPDAAAQLALARSGLAKPYSLDERLLAALWLVRAAVQLGLPEDARAIYATVSHEQSAQPWAVQLAAEARRLGFAP